MFSVFENIKTVLWMALMMLLCLLGWMLISVLSSPYTYHSIQPSPNAFGFTLYLGGRLIGSH